MIIQAKTAEVVFGSELNSPTRRSVVAELQLLKECCNDSESVDADLLTILLEELKSQSGLASLELSDRAIVGMSLNTHKNAANSVIVGGFKTLDSYRKAALESLRKRLVRISRPSRGTIEFYKMECKKKSEENSALIDDMTLLTARLDNIMEYARKLAAKANKSQEFLDKQSELLRKFPPKSK